MQNSDLAADQPPTATPPAAASAVVAAGEAAWAANQRQHVGVPDVVLVLGTGVERGRLVKLGHWWGGRWIADGDVRGEVLLAGEALHLPPEAVFEVLLHEAAHGLNAARGVKDSSRGGRYHNARFKATAEELGLVVAPMPPYGWAQTSIGSDARQRYDAEIARLGDAMRIARRVAADPRLADAAEVEGREGADREGRGRARDRQGAAECGCGRRMRMAPSVLARGPVVCGLCGHEFAAGRNVEKGREARTATTTTPIDARFAERRTEHADAEQPQQTRLERRDDLTAVQREGLTTLLALGAHADGALLLAEAGAWYASRRAGNDQPLLGRDGAEVTAANDAARAMLKLDQTLDGPRLIVAGRELMTGDVVMVSDSTAVLEDVDSVTLPPSGVLGTVAGVDSEGGTFVVDFPIAGRHTIAIASPAATALTHAYAEHIDRTGAPLVDLRTLTTSPEPEPLAPVIELSR